jgi:hypothetical protein
MLVLSDYRSEEDVSLCFERQVFLALSPSVTKNKENQASGFTKPARHGIRRGVAPAAGEDSAVMSARRAQFIVPPRL